MKTETKDRTEILENAFSYISKFAGIPRYSTERPLSFNQSL